MFPDAFHSLPFCVVPWLFRSCVCFSCCCCLLLRTLQPGVGFCTPHPVPPLFWTLCNAGLARIGYSWKCFKDASLSCRPCSNASLSWYIDLSWPGPLPPHVQRLHSDIFSQPSGSSAPASILKHGTHSWPMSFWLCHFLFLEWMALWDKKPLFICKVHKNGYLFLP